MDMVCHTASGLKVAVEHRRMRSDEMGDGQGAKRDCSTTELRPDMVGATGFEPMTDNPMSSAHQNVSGQGAIWIALSLYELSYSRRNAKADLHRQPTVSDNPKSSAR